MKCARFPEDFRLYDPTNILSYARIVKRKSAEEFHDLFICDSGRNRILKVTSDSALTEFWGYHRQELLRPKGMCLLQVPDHDGLILICDSGHNKIKVLDPTNGKFQTIAGTGLKGKKDGRNNVAMFSNPSSIIVLNGTILVLDEGNGSVRSLVPQGVEHITFKWIFSKRCAFKVSTVLGGNGKGFADGKGSQNTIFRKPTVLSKVNRNAFCVADTSLRFAFRGAGKLDFSLTTIVKFTEEGQEESTFDLGPCKALPITYGSYRGLIIACGGTIQVLLLLENGKDGIAAMAGVVNAFKDDSVYRKREFRDMCIDGETGDILLLDGVNNELLLLELVKCTDVLQTLITKRQKMKKKETSENTEDKTKIKAAKTLEHIAYEKDHIKSHIRVKSPRRKAKSKKDKRRNKVTINIVESHHPHFQSSEEEETIHVQETVVVEKTKDDHDEEIKSLKSSQRQLLAKLDRLRSKNNALKKSNSILVNENNKLINLLDVCGTHMFNILLSNPNEKVVHEISQINQALAEIQKM